MELTLCDRPKEQDQSKLLIAELMTNEVAAAKIKGFSIKYYCDYDENECGCADLLGSFVELVDRGGGYLKTLKHVKCVSYTFTCGLRF